MMNCPKCNSQCNIEDYSSIGGSKEYWSCSECDEEMLMFCLKEDDRENVMKGCNKCIYQDSKIFYCPECADRILTEMDNKIKR